MYVNNRVTIKYIEVIIYSSQKRNFQVKPVPLENSSKHLRFRTRQGCLFKPVLFNIVVDVLSSGTGNTKNKKKAQIEKE